MLSPTVGSGRGMISERVCSRIIARTGNDLEVVSLFRRNRKAANHVTGENCCWTDQRFVLAHQHTHGRRSCVEPQDGFDGDSVLGSQRNLYVLYGVKTRALDAQFINA